MGFFFLNLNRRVAALEADKTQKKKELATYAETTKKITLLKKKIAQIQAKLDVIKTLKGKSKGRFICLMNWPWRYQRISCG